MTLRAPLAIWAIWAFLAVSVASVVSVITPSTAQAQAEGGGEASAQATADTSTTSGGGTSAGSPQTHSRRSSDRPLYVSAGAGVSLGLDAGAAAKFKLVQEIGYHFLPIGDHPGLFGGVTLGQSFIDYTILQVGVRVGIDFQIFEGSDFAIWLTPSVASGLGMYVVRSNVIGTNSRAYFDIQMAGDVKLVLGDGDLAIWLRPVSFDFFINGILLTRYDILGGVQLSL